MLRLPMNILQIGDDWPTDRVGGLNRYFVELVSHLPSAGAEVRGLVLGPEDVAERTHGAVRSFSRLSDPLPLRLWNARKSVVDELRSKKFDVLACPFRSVRCTARALLGRYANSHALSWTMGGREWRRRRSIRGAVGQAQFGATGISSGDAAQSYYPAPFSRNLLHDTVYRAIASGLFPEALTPSASTSPCREPKPGNAWAGRGTGPFCSRFAGWFGGWVWKT